MRACVRTEIGDRARARVPVGPRTSHTAPGRDWHSLLTPLPCLRIGARTCRVSPAAPRARFRAGIVVLSRRQLPPRGPGHLVAPERRAPRSLPGGRFSVCDSAVSNCSFSGVSSAAKSRKLPIWKGVWGRRPRAPGAECHQRSISLSAVRLITEALGVHTPGPTLAVRSRRSRETRGLTCAGEQPGVGGGGPGTPPRGPLTPVCVGPACGGPAALHPRWGQELLLRGSLDA